MRVSDENSGFNVPLRTPNTKHQKMSRFSAIDYSFAMKALRTGQWNYQEKFTSE